MTTELVNLGKTVLANYNCKGKSFKVIQSGGIKTVWKVETETGPVCLKRLRQTLDKALFTINAQEYMSKKGAKVPGIYRTKTGELYCIYGNEIFVLYQWVNGKNIVMDNPSDFKNAIAGIATFHRDSVGYKPPKECRISSKLGRWPHHFISQINRLQEWKETAGKSAQKSLSRVFLDNVDSSIRLGHQALDMLQKSYYNDWVKQSESQQTLCHQDYGDGNALITANGIHVIDLDSVTYDLPVRDLRKIIVKRMATNGRWDKDLIHSITGMYCKVNPLCKEQLRVLYIDLFFPHEFHDVAKNPFRKNKPIDASKLGKAAKLEQSKVKVLMPLLS